MNKTDKATARPWAVATNPGGPNDQPAFPSVRDCSGKPHGEDIVAMPLGDSDTVKANAALIVQAVNEYDALNNLAECCERAARMRAGTAQAFPRELLDKLATLTTLRKGTTQGKE